MIGNMNNAKVESGMLDSEYEPLVATPGAGFDVQTGGKWHKSFLGDPGARDGDGPRAPPAGLRRRRRHTRRASSFHQASSLSHGSGCPHLQLAAATLASAAPALGEELPHLRRRCPASPSKVPCMGSSAAAPTHAP